MSAFEDILNEDDDVTEPVETTEPTEPSDAPAAVAESPALEETETSAPAPVAEEAQPITREDGAQWSEKAQRWYKDGKIVAGEKPEAVAPSEPSVPSVPEAVVEPPKPEAPPAPIGEPWTVRGAGQKHAIPGAFVTPDGKLVVDGPENIARHRDIVAAGIQHLTNYGREKQEWVQQIKDAEARGEARSTKYNRASVYLFDKLAQHLGESNPQELELIRRELALELKSADLEIPRAPQAQEPAPEQIEQAFTVSLGSYVDELFEDAPKGVLSPEDAKDIRDAIAARMAAYAAEVDGQIMLDTHAVKRDFDREVKIIQRANATAIAAREQAQKAKAAAAFNAANTPKPSGSAPAKPKPTLVPAGAKPSGAKPSWDQRVNDIWKDADDDE